MSRVCILDPWALAAVFSAGAAAAAFVVGLHAGHLETVTMAGLIGAVSAFVFVMFGRDEAGGVILGRGAFWRARHLTEWQVDEATGEVTLVPEDAR